MGYSRKRWQPIKLDSGVVTRAHDKYITKAQTDDADATDKSKAERCTLKGDHYYTKRSGSVIGTHENGGNLIKLDSGVITRAHDKYIEKAPTSDADATSPSAGPTTGLPQLTRE